MVQHSTGDDFDPGGLQQPALVFNLLFPVFGSGPMSTQYVHDYYVSKSVIRKDLERIGDWFKRFDLELLSKQKVGLMIEGTELNRRLALTRLSQLVDDGADSFISAQFTQHEITIVRRRLEELQERFDLHLTDETFERRRHRYSASMR